MQKNPKHKELKCWTFCHRYSSKAGQTYLLLWQLPKSLKESDIPEVMMKSITSVFGDT